MRTSNTTATLARARQCCTNKVMPLPHRAPRRNKTQKSDNDQHIYTAINQDKLRMALGSIKQYRVRGSIRESIGVGQHGPGKKENRSRGLPRRLAAERFARSLDEAWAGLLASHSTRRSSFQPPGRPSAAAGAMVVRSAESFAHNPHAPRWCWDATVQTDLSIKRRKPLPLLKRVTGETRKSPRAYVVHSERKVSASSAH